MGLLCENIAAPVFRMVFISVDRTVSHCGYKKGPLYSKQTTILPLRLAIIYSLEKGGKVTESRKRSLELFPKQFLRLTTNYWYYLKSTRKYIMFTNQCFVGTRRRDKSSENCQEQESFGGKINEL